MNLAGGTDLSRTARSLRNQYAVGILVFLLVVALIGMSWRALRLESTLVHSIALADARHFTDAITEFRTLYASEVVERVRANGTIVTHDYQKHDGAIPLPATLSILLGNKLGAEAGTEIMLYSDYPFPWRAENREQTKTDIFEAEALAALRQNSAAPYFAFVENKGQTVLKFATADLMRSACVDCHNTHPQTPKSDWQIGDVRGVLSITKSLDEPTNRARVSLRGVIPIILGTALLGILLLGFMATRLRKVAEMNHLLATQRSNSLRKLQAEMAQRIQAEDAQRNLQEQVQYAQKLETIGLLAGGVAHDFNNHLQGILGNANLAKSKTNENVQIEGHLAEIETGVGRASKLVKQLLAYAGQGSFTKGDLDISELIEQAQPLFAATHGGKFEIQYELEQGLPLFQADRTQLEQIMMNFVSNAAEAVDNKTGTVNVKTGLMELSEPEPSRKRSVSEFVPGKYIFMEVSDNGSGMDKATKDRMFDPYFTTKSYGHGLGLAACQGIVHSYNGFIHVSSRKGTGTTIRALFPVPKNAAKISAKDTMEELSEDVRTIMLVDDDEIVRSVAKQLIEKTGYEVIECATGSEAISVFEKHGPDIAAVVLDLKMSGMSGQDTFRHLTKQRKRLPIIISSGYEKDSEIQEMTADRAVCFLQKPYTLNEFTRSLREIGLADER